MEDEKAQKLVLRKLSSIIIGGLESFFYR